MAFAWTPGLILDITSGGILVLLGLGVLLIRPSRPASAALSWYAIGFGVVWVGVNLSFVASPSEPVHPVSYVVAAAGAWLASAGLGRLALHFPQRLARRDRRAVFGAAAVGIAVFAACISPLVWGRQELLLYSNQPAGSAPLFLGLTWWSASLMFGTMVGLLYLLFLRAGPSGAAGSRPLRQARLMTAGLSIWLAVSSTTASPTRISLVVDAPVALGLAVLAVLWTVRGIVRRERASVALGLFIVVCGAAGLAYWQVLGIETGNNAGGMGLARILGVLILGYAILRQQLLGIELKLKWTLRRGALAAIILAAFFVVSQLVQTFVGGFVPGLAGAAVAGLLLFAITPLQRFADRLADKAMPGVADTKEYRTVRKREVYRAAVESAMEDGVITAKERGVLATLADQLGLGAKEAHDVEKAALAARSPG